MPWDNYRQIKDLRVESNESSLGCGEMEALFIAILYRDSDYNSDQLMLNLPKEDIIFTCVSEYAVININIVIKSLEYKVPLKMSLQPKAGKKNI